MKKSRIILKTLLVLVLAVILLTMSISGPTFSWFERPKSKEGGALALPVPYGDTDPNGAALSMKAYDGTDLTMESYVSTDDVTFSETAADPATSGNLAPGHRNYYNTKITNNGATEQRVSLFLKNFTPGGEPGANICVGVNNPIKAFKNYSRYGQVIPPATKNKKSGSVKRVYFEPVGRVPGGDNYDEHRNTWGGGTYYVKSGNNVDSNVESSEVMTQIGTSGIYYADIPAGHNQLYFSVVAVPQNYQRTQTFTNLNGDGLSMTQSLLFYTNGNYTDYNNAWAGKENVVGESFAQYYNSVSMSVGQTIEAGLTQNSDYGGNSIAYSSSDTSIFSVDNTGKITANAAGSGTLTYTVTSAKGETATATANVVVHSYSSSSTTITNAPIVTNLLVPSGSTVEVWWFIQNGDYDRDGNALSTSNATYSHNGIFFSV